MRETKKRTLPKLSVGQWILFPIVTGILILALVTFYDYGGFCRVNGCSADDPVYGLIEGINVLLFLLGCMISVFSMIAVGIALLIGINSGLAGEW